MPAVKTYSKNGAAGNFFDPSYFVTPLVYGPFELSNKHSRLDFCPRPARKKTNVQLLTQNKLRAYCLSIYTVCIHLVDLVLFMCH